jgi:hypothetical protein
MYISLKNPYSYRGGGHWKWWALRLMFIKLPMYLFFYMVPGLNDFEVSKIHYFGHWKGWTLKILIFWVQMVRGGQNDTFYL